MSDLDDILVLPPSTGTRLITSRTDPMVLTGYRETDARTSLTRALKEYIEPLVIDWPGGRQSRFIKVLETWSEPEDPAAYPGCVVYAFEGGDYDASRFTPRLFTVDNDTVAMKEVSEFVQQLVVEVWATNPQERMALVAMLEDAFDPVTWMSGFRLEMPHYHSSRATFEKISMAYEDDQVTAQRRHRKAIFILQGNVTQYRREAEMPARLRGKVRVTVEATESVRISSGPNAGTIVDLDC